MTKRTKSDRKREKRLSIVPPQREPNGRVQRSKNRPTETARQARETAIEARKRQYGLTEKQAKDPDAATFIGRAYLQGDLSSEQKNTAEWFGTAVMQYRNAIQSPGRAKGRAGHAEFESEDYQRYCEEAKRRFDGIVAVLRERDIASRTTNSLGLLEAAIVRDMENWRQIGDIREALNVLSRWKSEGDEKSSCIVPANQGMVISVRTA